MKHDDIVTVTIDGTTYYGKVQQIKGTIINVKPDGLPARDFHINAVHPTNYRSEKDYILDHYGEDEPPICSSCYNPVSSGTVYCDEHEVTPIPYEEGMMKEE